MAPVLEGRTVVRVGGSSPDTAALVVAADNDVRDLEVLHAVLKTSKEIAVGVHDLVAHIAVHEDGAVFLAHNLIRRHAGVRAADPHVVGLVVADVAGKVPRIVGDLVGPAGSVKH
eukprot:scaffold651_cov252-Pinguiococcus_pyrenoidosus.AAC.8